MRKSYIPLYLLTGCLFLAQIVTAQTSPVEALPAGVRPGINYHEDPTKATLVLQAPGKNFAYVAGDFNSWSPDDTYLMNQTPDGEHFWYLLENLESQKEYVFQYWVDDEIKIGDPYADKVADPWNDGLIRNETYPNLPNYNQTDYGIATVLQTGQEAYQWSSEEQTWQRPDIDHLVIYELLVRDFMKEHTFKALIDTLDYIKNLGVDAIEVMPFNEFEGNESWGYNPSYYFAPDKYYGPKDELKQFIEAAHQKGLAIIMDMVLNHAYGQNSMVQLFFNKDTGKPAADNPWFNVDHVGPFEWGYDFDHESEYTKQFMDSVNRYWIREYHVDGFRFDFTKGFTNNGPNIDGYDQDRIDILKRMADRIWEIDSDSYIILEHWGPSEEESNLAEYGMKLWSNRSYDYVPAIIGNSGGGFGSMDRESHVSFYNSHDERRIAEHALTEGLNRDGYDIKSPLVMYERMKLAAAFTYLYPGPKMIWQFDELGYDIDINFNGRTGNKPLPWGNDGLGYYEDSLRQHIYTAFAEILDLRRQVTPEALANAVTDHKETGGTRRLSFDTDNIDLVIIGNFGLSTSSISPAFSETGTWYRYLQGTEVEISSTSAPISLQPGEWHIYTSVKLSDGNPGVNIPYSNPVVITPSKFDVDTEITITFDATKASPGTTSGLVGAEKVYLHSGLVLQHPDSSRLEKAVGNDTDDGVGLMTKIGDDLWSITITPREYFTLNDRDEPYKLGMYFRDANNDNTGLGFRNTTIYYNFESNAPFVSIDPPSFRIDDRITITYNSRKGNQELLGAEKIYMHSSMDLTLSDKPWDTGWNYAVGNWGQDDGVGEMSPVEGRPGYWEISMIPEEYYNLPEGSTAFWLSAVFRSADGSVKGTGPVGPLQNGLIHSNQDYFIWNELITGIDEDIEVQESFSLYPNPTSGFVNFTTDSPQWAVSIFSVTGQTVFQQKGSAREYSFDISGFPQGIYLFQVQTDTRIQTKRIIKQ